MAGENEKRLRTTAKRKFTRCYNRLNETILNKGEKDIVVTKFSDLKLLWGDVQTTHDNYLFSVYPDDTDEVTKADEDWLNELEGKFEVIEKLKYDYLRSIELNEKRDNDLKIEKRLIDQSNENIVTTSRNRESSKVLLIQEIRGIEDLIKMDKNKILKSQIVAGVKDVKLQLEKCKQAHVMYTSNFSKEKVFSENRWIEEVYSMYEKLNEKVYQYLESVTEIEMKQKRNVGMRMEPMRMPSFEGNIRHYAKFKEDFQKQVAIQVDCEHTEAYILKSCLSGEALSAVENIDDVKGIWGRLDKKFGQPSYLIDMAMNEVREIQPTRENDQKAFIQFVNVIERGYADLRRLKLEKEMSNSLTVSLIEGKLPPSIKHEWSKEVNKTDSKVDPYDKFPQFLNFLLEQRSILEYEMANLRISDTSNFSTGMINHGMRGSAERDANRFSRCIFHRSLNNHSTEQCRDYISKPPQERLQLLKQLRACWSCLKIGHRLSECRNRKACGVSNCTMHHHHTLHEPEPEPEEQTGEANTLSDGGREVSMKCLLPLMKVKSNGADLTVLWDSGASISLITFQKARELNLKGKRVDLTVIKVGGQAERTSSLLYTLPLIDKRNDVVIIQVYGIERISQGTQRDDVSSVIGLFKGIDVRELRIPKAGEVDVVIGFDHASLHPSIMQTAENLVIMENRFGKCLAGSHVKLKESKLLLVDYAELYHVTASEESFLSIEEMGIQSYPLCGNCSCGRCALGTKGLSIQEEREQNLINQGLSYQEEEQCFVAVYPWVRNPIELPDNYNMALHRLQSTEKRLLNNPAHAQVYDDQITDILDRGVATRLTEEEIRTYSGPYYYLCHHEVLKEGSSTPCRIVFNSSAKYMNQCLNDYWAKGAKLVNNLIGVLLRFRENKIAICGDIRKMYHSVKISLLDQHTHRFLWRNMRIDDKPDIYVMTAVSFGDKPVGNIAIAALHKTAERGKDVFPEAADTVTNNTYVDDIIDSVEDEASAEKMTKDIDVLLQAGGFKVKKWITSKGNAAEERDSKTFTDNHNVLGMLWTKSTDVFRYSVRLKFKKKKEYSNCSEELTKSDVPEKLPKRITKRMMLSQINTIFDPLGLIAPFTVKAKILLRNLWRQKLD